MNINVSCEACNGDLEIVREWSERGDIEITVNPCEYCLHKSRPTPVAAHAGVGKPERSAMKEKVLLEINRARVDLDFDSLSDEQYIMVCERLASIESALLEEAAEQKLRWTRLPPQVIRDWSGEEEDKAWAHLDNPHAPE